MTMMKTLALVMTMLCLARAYNFQARGNKAADNKQKRDGEDEEPETYDITGAHIQYGMVLAKSTIYTYKEQIDTLVNQALRLETSHSEVDDLVTNVANVMNNGTEIYGGTLHALEGALDAMFRGTNAFRPEFQCNRMYNIIFDEGFTGFQTENDMKNMLRALAKDLICIETLLTEVYDLEAYLVKDQDLSERDVLQGILNALSDLFKLRNEGYLLYMAMHRATHTINQGLHDKFKDTFKYDKKSLGTDTLLEKLLAALQKKRN